MDINNCIVKEKIYILKSELPDPSELKGLALRFYNGETLTSFEETKTHYTLGSGFLSNLNVKTLIDERVDIEVEDKLTFKATLYSQQEDAVSEFFENGELKHSGILQAKPSWGKTFAATNLLVKSRKKTLILVHTKLLWNQWREEIEKQTGYIPGAIGDGVYDVKDVTVGIYISVRNNIEKLKNEFSLLIVDECHKCLANMFSEVVNSINSKFKIGLSATPRRKDGRHLLLPDYFGPLRVKALHWKEQLIPDVHILQSTFTFSSINPKRDWAKSLTKLYGNTAFLDLIAKIANKKIANGRCVLILAPRKEALTYLETKITRSRILIGATKDEERKEILNKAGKGVDCILTTTIFNEGISCHRIDTLIRTEPKSNLDDLEQLIGRIQRDHPDKLSQLVIDIWLKGPMVRNQQANRYNWYIINKYNVFNII